MKKVLSIMLIILVVFSSMPMTVFGAENQDNSNDEFTYALSEDNAIITAITVVICLWIFLLKLTDTV